MKKEVKILMSDKSGMRDKLKQQTINDSHD